MKTEKMYCIIEKIATTQGTQVVKTIHSIYLDLDKAKKAAEELYKKYRYDEKLFLFDYDDYFYILEYIRRFNAIPVEESKLYIGDKCYGCLYPSKEHKPTDKGIESVEFANKVFEIYKNPMFHEFIEDIYQRGMSVVLGIKEKIKSGLTAYHIKYFLEHFEEYVTKYYKRDALYSVMEVDGNIDTTKLNF